MSIRLTDLGTEMTGRLATVTSNAARVLHDVVDDTSAFIDEAVRLTGWADDGSMAFDARDVLVERLREPSGRLHVISLPSKAGDIGRTRDWVLNTDSTMARQFHMSWPTTLIENRQMVRAVEDSPHSALWWDPDSDDLPVFVAAHGNSTGFALKVQERPNAPLPRRLPKLHDVFTDGVQFGRLLVAMREEIDRVAASPHSPIVLLGCQTGQRHAEAGRWASTEIHQAGIQRDVYASSGIVYVRPSGHIVIAPSSDRSGDIEPIWTKYPWQAATIP
ncbi:hypothetical protein [Nocardia testacea]|uniref:hypothetical protein n=1 Tax=Nocardia testacea TaxID=248551 RepID=UPI0033BFD71F